MNSSWMLSSVLVSMLIGAAALCTERVFMLRRGTPVRWVWLAAIMVSIGWSALWLLPTREAVEPPIAVPSISPESPEIVVPSGAISETASPSPESRSIDWTPELAIMRVPPLSEQAESRVRLAYLCTSVVLLAALAWSHLRLTSERRRWRATSLLGSDVLVSNGFGPAIVGMRRPSIVVPPWVLDVEGSAQRAILLHEDEHRRAGDQWLLLASFGALVLAPWNVALWLMRRRLARAIELDCDERVLTHGVADAEYANVLLNAWQLARGVVPWVPTPALAEHGSHLGRRVEHLMRPTPQGILMKTIGGTFLSFIVIGAAVLVPAPQQAQSRPTIPPPPPPAAVPLLPAPERAQVPPVPSRAQAPSVPVPVRGEVPPVPPAALGKSVPMPQREVPPVPAPALSKRPPVPPPASSVTAPPPAPSGIQNPAIPVPTTAPSIPQKRGRLLVVMPWDSSAAPLVSAVHERLAADTRGKSVDVISHADFVRFAKAAGFDSFASLKPNDVQAMSQLVRADLVVALEVRPKESRILYVEATAIDPGEGVLVRILDGDGSVPAIADVLVKALHNVPAYQRLLQSQSGTASAPTVRYLLDSTGRVVGTTWKTRSNYDTAVHFYRPRSVANTWKARFFIMDTANYKFSFRFLPSANPWFSRFGFDSTNHAIRFRSPPLG